MREITWTLGHIHMYKLVMTVASYGQMSCMSYMYLLELATRLSMNVCIALMTSIL